MSDLEHRLRAFAAEADEPGDPHRIYAAAAADAHRYRRRTAAAAAGVVLVGTISVAALIAVPGSPTTLRTAEAPPPATATPTPTDLSVSPVPETGSVLVPDVVGLPSQMAVALLVHLGLTPFTVTDLEEPAGPIVATQDPAPATSVAPGTAVTITIRNVPIAELCATGDRPDIANDVRYHLLRQPDAEALAASNGDVIRVVSVNGQARPITRDLNPQRVNLDVVNGVVVRSCRY